MAKSSDEHSILNEPHLQGDYQVDPREAKAIERVDRDLATAGLDEQVDHTVWDEVARSEVLSGKPPRDALTFANWYAYRASQMDLIKSWVITAMLAIAAGPWSIIGTIITMVSNSGDMAGGQPMAITIFGPLVEEIMKLAAVIWVCEKRPYYFKSGFQIAICALCSGLVFATLENLLYLNVYIKDPTIGIIYWRWIVCTALHVSCTFIGGIGLMRMWNHTNRDMSPPRLTLAAPFLLAGVIIHGLYNAFALIWQLSGHQF